MLKAYIRLTVEVAIPRRRPCGPPTWDSQGPRDHRPAVAPEDLGLLCVREDQPVLKHTRFLFSMIVFDSIIPVWPLTSVVLLLLAASLSE